ncbi:OmpL47-type beta-barrel domain-containing protein [Amycolatopsis sp.]|uniref:OmpL47-type beta-barrel domain-containing protein n=1 Tax=Amycolatopsis sp. TaxID=37632 RepID=UPI002D7EB0B7|nr:copper-binding protein [Amycolatopsis sp.]HET6711986.1 copper-binding protein [Amycolatopsis sp.]
MSPRLIALLLAAFLAVLGLATPAAAAPVQTLTWTGNNSTTEYGSAPTGARPGETTIVFENSEATGNTTGMSHTLTFDTTTPGYNHDVTLNILANPFDPQDGRHEAVVTLTPGKYRYYCTIPGHTAMAGEFVVSDGGGDTLPPVVTASVAGERDPAGNYLESATVTLSATDAGSGVASVEYQLDGGTWTTYAAPVVVSAVGTHMLHYRATDVAGNTSEEGMAHFTVVEGPGDTTPPTVTASIAGNKDPAGNYLDVATVSLSAADADSAVRSVEYQLDGGAWTAYTAPVAVTAPGAHMLHYRATDVAGNVSPEGMAHFTVVRSDTTAPVVSASVAGTQDADGSYVGKATVTVTASDAGSGVAAVEYKVDSGAWTAYTAPVPVSAVGSHTVGYRARDVAGNASAEGSVSFTVVAGGDTTAPSVALQVTGEQDGGWNYVGSATVTVTASDAGSGVGLVEYKVDSGAWTRYTAPVVVSALGAHTVRARATDVAGNVSAELTGAFTVVAAPPPPDACPSSDTRETVVIGGIDSQVANTDTGNGCTINDVIAENAEYTSHDRFVKHVKAVTQELVANGVLSTGDRNRIVTAAIESGVGGGPAPADRSHAPQCGVRCM